MQDILFHAHSGIRYLVLLTGAVALAYTVAALVRSRPWDRTGRILYGAFVGVLDLQVLLGVILVLVWPFYPALIGHIVMMLLAVSAAHAVGVVQRRRSPERQSHGLALVGVAGALLLVVAGIMAIQRPIL